MPTPLLDPERLATVSEPRVVLDCRSGATAAAAYAAGHLPGALHVDLDRDLAVPTRHPAQGGRHPLPPPGAFAERVGSWGITPLTHVVAYDDQGGANAAARLWWMLRALGHERVQVLDGGLQAAVARGAALTSEIPTVVPVGPYLTRAAAWPTADIDEVERVRSRDDHRVLDVRAAPRFRGDHEPIDPIAGHIPGAHNVPFTDNLGPDGRFVAPDVLRARYAAVLGDTPPQRLIVHCGSGVTACHTLLALAHAGIAGARLYVGSWSEWCRQPERSREPPAPRRPGG